MPKTIIIDGMKCACYPNARSNRISYMLYPDMGNFFPEEWIDNLSKQYNVSIVLVYIPGDRWNDMLTPWPEPPEAPGCQPFAGNAEYTLNLLQQQIVPQCETAMNISSNPERSLTGVSLSGLFALWQWFRCRTFSNIACLSGSFWYDGFMTWFDAQTIPSNSGKVYFLLGRQEPQASIKAYRTVGVNTEAIFQRLNAAGVTTQFDRVPGKHISNPMPRAEKAMDYLFGNK